MIGVALGIRLSVHRCTTVADTMYPANHILLVCLCVVHFAFSGSNPVESTGKPADGLDENVDQIIDQRQNGSENLRIHMNDLTLMVAPSDGILQLMTASASDLLNSSNDAPNSGPNKPTTYSDCGNNDPVAKCKQQPHKKNQRIRLSSLLVPLLNRAMGN